jgi:two-component system, cell cycle response regulator
VRPSGQLPRRGLFAFVAVALGVFAVHAATGFGGASVARFFADDWYTGLELIGVLACAARVVLVREHRRAWTCITAAFAFWTAGDVAWLVDPNASSPSLADALYLLFYPLAIAGLALLLADDRRHLAARLWVDGLVAALAVVALVAALAFDPILNATDGTPAQTAVNLAYPVADLLVIGFVITAFATQSWRPGRAWVLLGLGMSLSAVADTVYLYQSALGTYVDGSLVDAMWPTALLCCAWAAWQPWTPPSRRYSLGRQTFALPAAFALLALGLLVYGQFAPLSHLAAVAASAALLVAIARAGWIFRDNVAMLRGARREALTDGLTGLPNRRRLMRDLERAVAHADRPATFAFFDLDGFKTYNDGFGHGAGDMLLDRLAGRLAVAAAGSGVAYRLGGDEFCVLLDGRHAPGGEAIAACRQALTEQGEGFRVGSSCGVVAIPEEASSAHQALQLADQRMYEAKDATRTSSRRQTRDVLMQVLGERDPELHEHLQGVAALAVAVGRKLALSAEQLDEIARAAELHDIGKVAIPDEILHKPGPLAAAEWDLMRQHTVTGERILAAAPAMRPVAAIVRASHERFDGGGYPDRLAGEEIPLGARVVAVCDAFHAMTNERAYQHARDPEAALAELRRCAGTQFDPAVVDAFDAIVHSGADVRGAEARAGAVSS